MQFQQIRSATSIVTFGGKRFLIDPMLAPANTYPIVPEAPVCGKGNPTIELACKPEDLFDVDAVIVTHWHFDHFDETAMKLLPKELPLFAQTEEEAQASRKIGFKDVRVLKEEGIDFEGIRLFKTPCDHGSGDLVNKRFYRVVQLTDQACGVIFKSESADQACGVIFKSDSENITFYLAGDTIYYPGVKETIEKYAPQVIAVNAAGAQAPTGHALIMNQYDVWALMNDFPSLSVIATHVEGVSHATVNREMLRAFAKEKGLTALAIPDDLETITY